MGHSLACSGGVNIFSMIYSVFLASVAAVTLAAPEADPQILAGLPYAYGGLPYAGLHLGGAVGAVAHVPVVKGVVETPAEVATEVTAHAVPVALGYHGLGYGGHYIGKRSADADPAILAGSTRILTPPTPLIHNPPVRPVVAAAPVAAYHAAPLAYAGYGLPVARHVIAKREAEADPQLLLPYAAHHAAVLPLAAAHAVAHVPVVKSVVETPAEVATEVKAHAVPVAVGYHGYGLPYWG